jgi:hypothetical protein
MIKAERLMVPPDIDCATDVFVPWRGCVRDSMARDKWEDDLVTPRLKSILGDQVTYSRLQNDGSFFEKHTHDFLFSERAWHHRQRHRWFPLP